MTFKRKPLSILALALCASPWVLAQEAPGWYGGLSAGTSTSKIDDARITSGLLGTGISTSSIVDRDQDHGYKVFGGYSFNKNFAVEGGYFDLGKFGFTANTVPTGTLNGNIRLRGLNLDMVGTLPVSERLSVIGRLGLNYAEAADDFTGTGAVNVLNPNPSKRDTNPKIGIGLQYDFTESVGLRLEAERYRVNDAVGNRGDIDLLTLGLVFRFGAPTPPPAPARPLAEPVTRTAPLPESTVAAVAEPVATPAPAPVAVVESPPPAPIKVTLAADSMFDFDKAMIKPEGKAHLDRLIKDLRGVNFDAIKVTGHTDRIGAAAYNMKLSTRRAEMVQAYLVENLGIPAQKVTAVGVGSTEAITQVGDCPKGMPSKELIACLQPDRRVNVEVLGTKSPN